MKKTCLIILVALLSNICFAQVSIISTPVNEYNISSTSLLDLNILNTQSEIQVIVEAKIFNAQNEVLLTVLSNPFLIKSGMNATSQLNVSVASSGYSSSDDANYIRINHLLPSGKFHYCAVLKTYPNDLIVADFCQDLETAISSFLFLVNPLDKEEINTKLPMLIWTHTEPFNKGNTNDYYKMVVTELNFDESAESAINTNIPVFTKSYLSSHNIQYPVDARELQWGKDYAWQVQKISNGIIVNKTEAWSFKLKSENKPQENKYAVLKIKPDGDIYFTERYIYFTYNEQYISENTKVSIIDGKNKVVDLKAKNDLNKTAPEIKKIGDNRFSIDLYQFNVKQDFYTLQVVNSKNETSSLKFYVQ